MKHLIARNSGSLARALLAATAVAASWTPVQSSAHVKPVPPQDEKEKVQLAILLDTSGSMSGLIEQTKTQLWRIVNTFVEAERGGQTPYVEVALYQYGNSGLHSGEHWIQLIKPFTRDLDALSEDLFSLRTNGGEEYCGAVIRRAVHELDWDHDADVYKAIFVAGNEPFTQGPIDPVESCRLASKLGIYVNTIHCGGEQAGISGGWKMGSSIADGTFLNINHNKHVVHVTAPQDAKILELNIKLNSTYIPYGKHGAARWEAQSVQDTNAAANKSIVSRAACKSSANYWNGNWDLVDASTGKGFSWEKVDKKDLPEGMRGLSLAECKAEVEVQRRKRAEIQKEIRELNTARTKYVAEVQAKKGDATSDTLGQVVEETVRKQAAERGYEFAKN